MINVLHVYRTYYPDTQGGVEEVIRQICQNVDHKAIQSRVFTFSKNPVPGEIKENDIGIFRFPNHIEIASCAISFSALSGFKKLVRWADIVHYHFPWPFADILHFIGKVNKPTVLTYHSDVVRQKGLLKLYQPLMNRFLGAVDAIVATSPNYLNSSEILAKYNNKTRVIPIGIEEGSYPAAKSSSVSLDKNYFLFVGNLRYYKGLHVLLEAAQDQPFNILIAGSGGEEQKLKELAKTRKLNNVTFLGFVSDEEKVALMKSCLAVVFPSHLRSEAFGVTLLEGAMYGKPLISTEIGTGTSYVNQDNVTGFVVPPADPVSLREAMLKLHHNPGLAISMGLAARERYETLFTGKMMGDKYTSLYQEIAGK